jgi:tRNA G18 (ribose-2'-O)-methylase SpoU
MFRSADGLGVSKIYLSGYTPYPASKNDERLPHIRNSLEKKINKTALGAQKLVLWEKIESIEELIKSLKQDGFTVAALEQTPEALDITTYESPNMVALIVGEETAGLPQTILDICDIHLQIPMLGKKESFNVSVAAAIGLYGLRYHSPIS